MRKIKPIYRLLGIVCCMVFSLQLYGAGSSLTIQDTTVTEGDTGTTDMEFTIYHTILSPFPVSIYYSTMDDTAKAGIDYVAKSGTLILPPGQRTMTLLIPIINDLKLTKNNKRLKVSIASSTRILKSIAIGTILDNDTQPTNAAAEKNPQVTKGDNREIRK